MANLNRAQPDPGATVLIRMPRGLNSVDMPLLSLLSAALAAAVGVDSNRGQTPVMNEHCATVLCRRARCRDGPLRATARRSTWNQSKIIVNDTTLIRDFALAGLGLAYLPDMEAGADIAAGRLERVLAEFVPVTSGLFLYFPVRTQQQPKLRAFIDLALETLPRVD